MVKRSTEIGYNIVATTIDNHSSNMKFFTTLLCGGKLKSYIMNPFVSNRKIFLLSDFTHILKCIYNNFRGKDSFVIPPFDGTGPNMYPMFSSIEGVHNAEIGMPIKYAH